MINPDRPKPEIFHRLRPPPPLIPKPVKMWLFILLGVVVLLFSGCAMLFGSLVANALGRVEPTHELITSIGVMGGFETSGDPRLAENPELTPDALARLNAEFVALGSTVFVSKPECGAHSYRGMEERSGDFVTCTAHVNYLQASGKTVEVVWVKQRGTWRVDNYTLRDMNPSEITPASSAD